MVDNCKNAGYQPSTILIFLGEKNEKMAMFLLSIEIPHKVVKKSNNEAEKNIANS